MKFKGFRKLYEELLRRAARNSVSLGAIFNYAMFPKEDIIIYCIFSLIKTLVNLIAFI